MIPIKIKKLFTEDFFNVIKSFEIRNVIGFKLPDDLHDELFEIMLLYMTKISNGYPKNILNKIIKKDKIEFVLVKDYPFNNYAYFDIGVMEEFKVKVYIKITNEIKPNDINDPELMVKIKKAIKEEFTDNIKDIIYSVYQEVIRYSIFEEFNRAKYDEKLLVLASKLLGSTIIRIFGKKYAPTLTDENIKMCYILSSYIILTSFIKEDPKIAVKYVHEIYSKIKGYEDIADRFKKLANEYKITQIRDFKKFSLLLSDFSIIKITPIKFVHELTTTLGSKLLLDLIASYGGLISNFIVAKYPVSYESKKMVFGSLNDELEEHVITNYTVKIKF